MARRRPKRFVVTQIATLPDGSVVLTGPDGSALVVRRVNDVYSFAARGARATDGEHSINVSDIGDSIAF